MSKSFQRRVLGAPVRPEEENSECLLYGFRGTTPSKLENDDKEDGGREEKRGEEGRGEVRGKVHCPCVPVG